MRSEFKYIVPNKYLDEIHSKLVHYLDFDKYASIRKEKEYICRSIYYDTSDLDAFYEKEDGVKIRKKLRIRGYNYLTENCTTFLEIKRKVDNLVSKSRSLVYYKDLNSLLKSGNVENYEFPINNEKNFDDAIKFLYHYKLKSQKPTVLVVYDREAYVMKYDQTIRITFDKNLRCRAYPENKDLFSDDQLQIFLEGHFILEIKFFNYFPKIFMPNIIKNFNLIRSTYSKYTNACIFQQITNDFNLKPRIMNSPRYTYY